MASNHQHKDWLELRRDDETGIESVNAHFQGMPTIPTIMTKCWWA